MLFINEQMCVCMFEGLSGWGCSPGLTLPYLALTMIDAAICWELPMRAEHPPQWCIVGGVIYDDGSLWRLAGAYCAGRVWHGRPRSEQDWGAQAAWPEQCLVDLFLKRGELPASGNGGGMDSIICCTATWRRERGGWCTSKCGCRGKTWLMSDRAEEIFPPVIRCGPCTLCF